ncbi:MFS transporter [Veronia pacifica]|uniref:MFS transporter n=1 Tax=Veronia pacifica TaxID=1080227 RepID=A0A1C3EPG2_9GAMM|nr:MFS transporter [Veronia pacifica]ODA35116.1 MFS transporter [Veronia pacifica]
MNRNVWLLALSQALLMSGNVLLISVNGLIGQSLSPSPVWVTLPVATQFVGMMLATIPASLIMGRIGRKKGFIIGNTIGITGSMMCVYALYQQEFWLFCFCTLLLGIGIGFATLYRFAAVEVSAPEAKSRAISISMAGGVIAAVLGPNIAIHSKNWLSGAEFSGGFAALTMLYSFALIILLFIQFPPLTPKEAQPRPNSFASILSRPGYLLTVFTALVAYAVMNLLMTVTPIAMHKHGFSFEASAIVIEWHVLGMFAPAFITGHIIDRVGTRFTVLMGTTLIITCTLINIQGATEWHFRLALLLLGVGWNFMFIGATSALTEYYLPEDKAQAQAFNEFAVFGSVTVSALLSGQLESTLGWQVLNQVTLPLMIAVLVFYFFKSRVKPELASHQG